MRQESFACASLASPALPPCTDACAQVELYAIMAMFELHTHCQ